MVKKTALRAIHCLATRVSDFAQLLSRCAVSLDAFGERLWELGGGLECWCDEQLYDIERKRRIDEWKERIEHE